MVPPGRPGIEVTQRSSARCRHAIRVCLNRRGATSGALPSPGLVSKECLMSARTLARRANRGDGTHAFNVDIAATCTPVAGRRGLHRRRTRAKRRLDRTGAGIHRASIDCAPPQRLNYQRRQSRQSALLAARPSTETSSGRFRPRIRRRASASRARRSTTMQQIVTTVTNGRSDMPAWGSVYKPQDLQDLAGFILEELVGGD